MLSTSSVSLFVISILSLSELTLGRERWLERDGRAVFLYPRRFGQEHPAVIDKLSSACPGEVCGVLSGQAITPLLAAQPECSQQDMADSIIDAAQQFDDATKTNMIALAVEYRQAEKNTPPDFTTNPPTLRNSVFCQKAPKNSQLNGLVQAQDPSNDPNTFFDPATKASVTKGAQANTFPFGTSGSSTTDDTAASSAVSSSVAGTARADSSAVPSATQSGDNRAVVTSSAAAGDCVVTVTVTANDAAATPTDSAVTVNVGGSATASAPVASSTAAASAIGDFGKCSVPQIQFGVGFDNRKETSFEPVDQTSFNHGSAQNIDIITQFICDTLVNSCGADQTAKTTCASAKAAADTVTAKTGGQADAFNAVFGIQTNFAAVASIDDQGNVVSGTGSGTAASASPAASAAAASPTAASTTSSGIGNFGKCSVPKIDFAAGFDNRKETSFQPDDKASFNHGSAQNIDIITQFICDTLVNSCGADQTAQSTCSQAKAAADTQTAKTGAQADAFNAVFGITTDFAAVAAIDDQGNVVSAGTTGNAAAAAATPSSSSAVARSVAPTSTPTAAATTGSNLQTFTGTLGGVSPPTVTALANGQFQVTGNSAFNDLSNALTRSCDVQHNQCANAANASGNKGDLTVAACGDQQTQCNASQ